MALRSMTGYGSATGAVGDLQIAIEARTVNHKGLDIKMSLPPALASLEPRILSHARGRLDRGRVNLKINMEGGKSGGGAVFDLDAAAALGRQLEALRAALGIEAPVTLDHILTVPNLILKDPEQSFDAEAAWPQARAVLDAVLDALIAEQDREGQALCDDMMARLASIGTQLGRIEVAWPESRTHHLARLRDRVTDLVEQLRIEAISDERLAQEAILFAERTDISEEVTRTHAHLQMLQSIIPGHDPDADGPIGKKLDFYFQELIRESNTMGSKSQSEIIAACVVEIRSEIDRLREQVLNVA